MKQRKMISAVLCMCAALAAQASAAPQRRVEFAQVLPADVMAFFSVRDAAGAAERFQQTALYRIWREPEVQEFLQPLIVKAQRQLESLHANARRAGPVGQMALDLLKVKPDEIALAVLPPAQGAQPPAPRVAVVLAMHEGVEKIDAIFQILLPMLMQPPTGMKMGVAFKHEDVLVKEYLFPRFNVSAYYAVQGPRLLITTSKELMTQFLDGYRNPPAASLADSPAYAGLTKALRAAPDAAVVFNVKAAFAAYEPLLTAAPPDVVSALEGSGLKDIESIAWGLSIVGPGIRSATCVRAPGERRGFCALLDMPMGRKTLLNRIPAGALIAADANIDLGDAYDALVDLLRETNPVAYQQMQDRLAQWEKEAGVSVRADILGAVGDEAALYFAPPAEAALMVKVKNPQMLTKVLLKGLQAACEASAPKCRRGRTEPLSLTFEGVEIHYTAVRVGQLVLWPAFAMRGDLCCMALNPQTLKTVLRRKPKPSLAESPTFRTAVKQVASSHVAVSYVDTAGLVRPLYDVLAAVVQLGADDGDLRLAQRRLGVDWGRLPSPDAIARHLFPFVESYSVDDEGFVWQSYGPVSGEELSVLSTLSVAMVGVSPFRRIVRSNAEDAARSMAQLKQIGLAVAMYTADHDEAFPKPGEFPNALLPYVARKDVFYHPSNRGKPHGEFPADIDYEFSSTLPPRLPLVKNLQTTPLAWEKEPHDGQRAVLFCDGHVERMPERKARALGLAAPPRPAPNAP